MAYVVKGFSKQIFRLNVPANLVQNLEGLFEFSGEELSYEKIESF